jgi:SAM-dependent methyltransferase
LVQVAEVEKLLDSFGADKTRVALTLDEVRRVDDWLSEDWGIRFRSDCSTWEQLLCNGDDRNAVARYLEAHDQVADQMIHGRRLNQRALYEALAHPSVLGPISSQRRHFILDASCLAIGLARATQAKNALDVGCHAGFLPDLLSRFVAGLHVTGIDLCEPAIQMANEHCDGRSNLSFVASPLPLSGKPEFDLVMSVDSMPERPAAAVSFLREIAKVLRPGGLAMIVSDYCHDQDASDLKGQLRLADLGFGYGDVVGGYGQVPRRFEAESVLVLVKGSKRQTPPNLIERMKSEWPQFRDYANTAWTPIERKTQSYERAARKARGNGIGASPKVGSAEASAP